MRCAQCKKVQKELDSWWDRVRLFLFHFFHQDIIDLSDDKFQQGFGDGYRAGYQKHELESKAMLEMMLKSVQGHLYKLPVLDPTKIIIRNGSGNLIVDGRVLTKEEVENLKSEVNILERLEIWKQLQATIVSQGQKIIFDNSTKWEDVLTGKLMLYNLNVMNDIIQLIKKHK